jgi:hypothetical protein
MRAACLFLVLVLAKALVLACQGLPFSAWTPIAYFWQDALCALGFAVIEAIVRKPAVLWLLYAVAVLYIAMNVPLACTLATPLTWPMLRAARGTLADSILHHVTAANGVRFFGVLGAAAVLPMLRRKLHRRWLVVGGGLALLLAVLGPLATARVETLGLHRNLFAALVQSLLPRITPAQATADWRASPFGSPSGEDLTRFRAAAAGQNVVVIHLESTAARYLRPYGAADDPMPHLTVLSQQAIFFENAETTYPETIRSFFAVHVATFPALDIEAEPYAQVRTPALAQVLSRAGYACGLFHSGRFGYLGMDAVIQNRGFDVREDAGDIGGERDSSFGIDEESTIRRLLAWIDAVSSGQRFFATYLPIAGHHPYATRRSGPYPMTEEIDRYRNALHYADEAVSQLTQGLQQRGLLDKTLFVILGDHGEAFGQHDGNFGHAQFLYEENVHVPFLIVAPGLIEEHVRIGRVASLADTAPTILDLLGLTVPLEWQGRSLLDSRSRLALCCTDYSLGFLGLRDGRWKFIHELDSDRSWLFDLETDPAEHNDLADMEPDQTAVYRDHLRAWSAAQKYGIIHGRPPD